MLKIIFIVWDQSILRLIVTVSRSKNIFLLHYINSTESNLICLIKWGGFLQNNKNKFKIISKVLCHFYLKNQKIFSLPADFSTIMILWQSFLIQRTDHGEIEIRGKMWFFCDEVTRDNLSYAYQRLPFTYSLPFFYKRNIFL